MSTISHFPFGITAQQHADPEFYARNEFIHGGDYIIYTPGRHSSLWLLCYCGRRLTPAAIKSHNCTLSHIGTHIEKPNTDTNMPVYRLLGREYMRNMAETDREILKKEYRISETWGTLLNDIRADAENWPISEQDAKFMTMIEERNSMLSRVHTQEYEAMSQKERNRLTTPENYITQARDVYAIIELFRRFPDCVHDFEELNQNEKEKISHVVCRDPTILEFCDDVPTWLTEKITETRQSSALTADPFTVFKKREPYTEPKSITLQTETRERTETETKTEEIPEINSITIYIPIEYKRYYEKAEQTRNKINQKEKQRAGAITCQCSQIVTAAGYQKHITSKAHASQMIKQEKETKIRAQERALIDQAQERHPGKRIIIEYCENPFKRVRN